MKILGNCKKSFFLFVFFFLFFENYIISSSSFSHFLLSFSQFCRLFNNGTFVIYFYHLKLFPLFYLLRNCHFYFLTNNFPSFPLCFHLNYFNLIKFFSIFFIFKRIYIKFCFTFP